MFSENLDYGYVSRFLKLGLCGKWAESPGSLNIIFIQGATPSQEGFAPLRISSNDNAPDRYNDTHILARRNPKTGQPEIYVSRGTSEPGDSAKLNPKGAPYLCWGQHYFEPIRRAKDGRLVLQGKNGVTRFWRDKLRGGTRHVQEVDEVARTQAIGQWYHAMGKGETIQDWSLGCVGPRGGWDGEAWKTFRDWLKDHPKDKPIILTLWGIEDYCEFSTVMRHLVGPPQYNPTLRMGIRDLNTYGPVHRLQELLKKVHYDPGVVDGDWMNKTQVAFVEFQKANGLNPDGICGKASWNKLKQLIYGGNR